MSDICPYCSSGDLAHASDGSITCLDCEMSWNRPRKSSYWVRLDQYRWPNYHLQSHPHPKNLKRFWDKACYICGGQAESFDHVIPRSKGGANNKTNMQPCCETCNSAKGHMDLEDFLSLFSRGEWLALGQLQPSSRRGKIEAAKIVKGFKKNKAQKEAELRRRKELRDQWRAQNRETFNEVDI